MAKFRKKPVVVEAVQWTGLNYPELDRFTNGLVDAAALPYPRDESTPCPMLIRTLEGVMTADRRDWIIKGVAGEFYPCKPDIFEATYESVEEPSTC